ncbi:MAG TPA: acetyl-CoA acetyltransferase [Phenylobacterium sp.]
MDDNTPVIIGVGEASERIGEPGYAALSPVGLAAKAAQAALDDAGAAQTLAPAIDLVAGIRQFEISGARAVAPFGRSDNFPRSVANRIGANPATAILEPVGGQGPQHLVNELANRIGAGELGMALIFGSEAISTVRDLTTRGETKDWAETAPGSLEDRGYGPPLITAPLIDHGARTPIQVYAMFENARRAKTGLDREAYRRTMGELFAPFTRVAAGNPHAMSRAELDAETIATVTPDNRIVADPFPRRTVARDQANQGAAVLIASVGRARALGVPEDRWIYLHGGADAMERTPFERRDLAAYPAAGLAARRALEIAGRRADEIDVFDFYSCFPIAVTSVMDELGVAANDPRPRTVTGGLPFFGGAGNNYSMHAIAAMVRALRAQPQAYGLVGANGGFLSKYSVGVYSARPRAWRPFQSQDLQAQIDAWPAPAPAPADVLTGVVETYTVDHGRDPKHGVLVCRTPAGERFVAMTDPTHPQIVEQMLTQEPLGAAVACEMDDRGRRIVTRLG